MDKRTVLLLALLGALVVALFALSVGVSSDSGRTDPERAGGIEGLEGLLDEMPGIGREIDPSTIETDHDCFDGHRFLLDDATRTCSFAIPPDVDRVVLRLRHDVCEVDVGAQPGVAGQHLDLSDANNDGELRLGLTGDGVTVGLSMPFDATRCEIELE